MSVDIKFCGAAGIVTGSCYLVRHERGSFLVDCGMFQGNKTIRELNYGAFPFDAMEPGAILLTHSHIDHSGLIPKLILDGFNGEVFATDGTADLLTYMWPDSGHIQESEVERLNHRRTRRGERPIRPIYTEDEAEDALSRITRIEYGQWMEVMAGVRARYWNAGHILGSASIEIEIDDDDEKTPLRLLFSGDLGPGEKDFQPDPKAPSNMDFLILESTYGDIERPSITPEERRAMLRDEVHHALDKGGNLIIPSFAIERSQELLYDLTALFDEGALPPTEVYIDSPLAIRATGVFSQHLEEIGLKGNHPFRRPNLHYVMEAKKSKALARIHGGAIFLAASGMCDAGRVRHHLKNNLWRRDATVLLVGYQAPGTMGRLLMQGVKRVRIHGEEISVKAEIRSLEVYSGHADATDLTEWARKRQPVNGATFLVHGETPTRATLRKRLADSGWDEDKLFLPRLDETFTLSRQQAPLSRPGLPRLTEDKLSELDWHNAYAERVLELRRVLRRLGSDEEREVLLEKLHTVMREA